MTPEEKYADVIHDRGAALNVLHAAQVLEEMRIKYGFKSWADVPASGCRKQEAGHE
jgi:hypothetical protein